MKKFIIFFLIVLITSFINPSLANNEDPLIFKAIRNGVLEFVLNFIKTNDINGYYGSDSLTLLAYAINEDQLNIVKNLVKKSADVEQLCKNKTPLIYSIVNGRIKIARFLIKNGANPDGYNSKKNTALIYSAIYGELEMVKFLIKKGADLNFKNLAGNTAFDYANTLHKIEVANFLRSIFTESQSFSYPDYIDGPHIRWNDSINATVIYLVRDSSKNKSKMKQKSFVIKDNIYHFNGFASDNNQYVIYKKKQRENFQYDNVNKILAIGDIHGQYENLASFLINAQIVDENLNWQWEDGHLVFLGDIFDRGENVTECLWLIYKLEKQAQKAGGKVHYILGNHEIMIMTNDLRYLATKYFYLYNYHNRNYLRFYTKNTEFGRWLRTKSTILRINDMLFVHAGISPEITEAKFSMYKINNLIWDFLNYNIDSTNIESVNILLNSQGPFWYRGYLKSIGSYSKIDENELDEVLKYFQVSSIIVGHTKVDSVKSLFHKKVYTLDVSYYKNKNVLQGLLIYNNNFYRILFNGEKEKIE